MKQDSLSILASALPLLLKSCKSLIKFSLYLSLKPHCLLHCHPFVSSFYPKSAPAQKHSPVPNTPITYVLRQGELETETSILHLRVTFQGLESLCLHHSLNSTGCPRCRTAIIHLSQIKKLLKWKK